MIKQGLRHDYLLTLYLIERLLYRISISEYADKFVLKGGVLLYIVLEEKARATKDIEKIKEDADYEGGRVTAFLDRTKKVLQMDIGFGDVIVPCATEMEYPSLLEMKKPLLKAYSNDNVVINYIDNFVVFNFVKV